MDFELDLNKKQYEAVTTDSPFVRVIAGAGSGKTRVLTYRIAYLLKEKGIAPWNILAITFTNKVAAEMKERVEKLVPNLAKSLQIRTYHSFAAYFLRQECDILGFPKTFTILDEEDQKNMIKEIASDRGFKKGDAIVKSAIMYISKCKGKGQYPKDITYRHDEFENHKICLEMYEEYEAKKDKQFCFDFDDLLLQTNLILKSFPDIRSKWQRKITHLLVDEFQDSNDIEYELLKLLMTNDSELYVVGDPDQTIYTWRGANQKIMLEMEKMFPSLLTIPLERNYRSTQVILDAANKLISVNKLRIPKNLYTEQKGGEPIVLNGSYSFKEEANFVVKEIKRLNNLGYSYKDMAILYRSNFISSDFETALTQGGIHYRVYGGLKFFQRKEIKDVIAYFTLLINPKSDVCFERIVNVPRRGIGDTSLQTLKDEASNKNLSLYETIKNVDVKTTLINKKTYLSLQAMILRLELAKSEIDKKEEAFSKILDDLIQDLGYYEYIKNLDIEEADDRLDNIKKLFEDLRYYIGQNPESSLEEYLQNIALLSAQDDIENSNSVTLMTVHTAKGLEYPVVFVVRFNNQIFPNARAEAEAGFIGLEEERRLAYVAFTRAKERLIVSYANGYSFVAGSDLTESRFIKEAGLIKTPIFTQKTYVEEKKKPSYLSGFAEKFMDTPSSIPSQNSDGILWNVGDIAIHTKFGEGKVIEVTGDGLIKVDFKEHGIKLLIGSHPFLKRG